MESVEAAGAAVATLPAPPPAAPPAPPVAGGRAPVYTQSAWQRPDGRWLNRKEIKEVEQLARKYVAAKRSNNPRGLNKIMALVGLNRSGSDLAKIENRIQEIGIPYGIFQAYASARREK
ncbi:MAG: hypothetical protein ACLQVD_22170 [Capsulimonadaceae bacterium]